MKETINQYGVKVGDLFAASWGWEQTNIDFYQVVSITKTSARFVKVSPTVISREAVSGMSQDVTIEIPQNGEMLPRLERAWEIKDQVNGDLRRIHNYAAGEPRPQVNITQCITAYKCTGKTETLYQSWYA